MHRVLRALPDGQHDDHRADADHHARHDGAVRKRFAPSPARLRQALLSAWELPVFPIFVVNRKNRPLRAAASCRAPGKLIADDLAVQKAHLPFGMRRDIGLMGDDDGDAFGIKCARNT